MPTTRAAAEQPPSDKSLLYAAIVVVVGVLATTLAQNGILARIPLQNLLKNELHVDRSATAAFFFWIGLAWYVKPLIGIVSDAFPLFGSRRKSYMLLGGVVASVAWVAMTLVSHTYGALLAFAMFVEFALVIASTAMGGYMVEVASASASSGRLTSVRNFVEQFCYIISGPAGGFLGSVAFAWTALACGGVAFLIVPAAVWFLREKYVPPQSSRLLHNAGQQMGVIFRAKTMWATALIAALFYSAPGVTTAVFYAQQNDLHMQTQGQGFLTFLQGVGGVTSAAIYGGLAARRFTLRTLLVVCLLFGVASNLGYLFYTSVPRAQVIECFYGFGYTLAEVAIMHLCVRATPKGSEALGFSLMMAVRNFCLFGGDWLGSHLLDQYHLQFSTLVLFNAGTSLLAVPLVLMLPAVFVNVRDAQPAGK